MDNSVYIGFQKVAMANDDNNEETVLVTDNATIIIPNHGGIVALEPGKTYRVELTIEEVEGDGK